MALRITLDSDLPGYMQWWPIPRFRVWQDEQPLFVVDTILPKYPATLRYEQEHQELVIKHALLHYAVKQIEQGLQGGVFPIYQTQEVKTIKVEEKDFPLIERFMQEKTCAYQHKEGRDLLCTAASPKDPTAIGLIGLRTLAPTSRSICRECNFPDTDYLCSHLLHPEITVRPSTSNKGIREIATALCDLGRADISSPSQCRAGGHPCWERILEPEADVLVFPLTPLALPEALDFLDTVWHLWQKKPLFTWKSARGNAELALSCTTRDECMSRLSALADTLKSMVIPDDLLPEKNPQIPGDQTFNRLLACLKPQLEEADYQSCERAVGVLRAVNGVRTAFQHSEAARDLPSTLEKLSIPYPPPEWSETWDRIRAKTVEALGIIRETIRRLATS